MIPNHPPRNPTRTLRVFAALSWLLATVFATAASPRPHFERPHRPNRLLVIPREGADSAALDAWSSSHQLEVVRSHADLGGLRVLQTPNGAGLETLARELEASGVVEYVEPDYLLYAYLTPDDPAYQKGLTWNLHNTGQSSGLAGADIHAPEAWNTVTDASEVIVAIIDSGIRLTHEDLADNLWVNPGEIPDNGLDDDRNGVVDDVHGYDAVTNSGDPSDSEGHGTHVAGIIGAVGNNGRGSVGVAWKVRLMALKFMSNSGEGATSDAIACIDYARAKGAQIINASWGSAAFSRSLQRAIQRAQAAGILFVAAAGNDGVDLAVQPTYPAAFALDNIVAVTATTRRDTLASYGNVGATTVSLGAPGDAIYSTWSSSDRAYQQASGTSMATPHVAGALALLRAQHPSTDYRDLIAALEASVDPLPELQGRTRSGGRLNVQAALEWLAPQPALPPALTLARSPSGTDLVLQVSGTPGTSYWIELSGNLRDWTRLVQQVTDDDGNLQFVVPANGSLGSFYRVSSDE